MQGHAVALHAGAAVPPVVVGVHGEAVGGERVDQRPVAAGVLAHAVQQLDDATGRASGRVDVVDDRDAVCIDELGHGGSISALFT